MSDDKWIGKWFTPIKGKEYRVPENASNHTNLRGLEGTCTEVFQSSFGHSWARIYFISINALVWVRTRYLLPADGSEVNLVVPEAEGDTEDALRKAARVWARF